MNIVYNASAGTGKTYQVTQLYEKLVLDEGIDPRRILLMTFTNNAAAELRMRVSHRLMKARREAEKADNFELTEIAIAAMKHLSSAPICTMDAYCSMLVREHALEAGLSPRFTVMDENDRNELLDRICREELLLRLETDPDFKTFCSGANIIGSGKGFGTSVTEAVPKLINEAGSLGIDLKNVAAMLTEPLPPISIADFIQIKNDLENLSNQTKKITEAIKALDIALEQAEEPLHFLEIFGQNFSGHFSYGEAKTIYPRFKELKEETVTRERYRKRYPAAKAFARYAQAVARKFDQQKHEMDAVYFDDLLRQAVALLNSGKANPEFEYVIVDEVQDTSRIQCDLIELIWKQAGRLRYNTGSESTAGVPPASRLVICGDKKQSIYTWRGADPQVMPDLEQAIQEKENSRLENLQTSYRSKAPILDVINTLFALVYGEEEYSNGDRLETNPDFKADGEKPCVEFLEFDGEEEDSKQDKTAAEMEAVANRIQLLVNNSDWSPEFRYANGFEAVSETNKYKYSDILILLRRTTHQTALEQALRHANIPYTLGGKGRGLFTRQETRDVSLFLNVITNPDDAYSLIGFLRSPWIGMSDEQIAEIAWSNGEFSIDHLKTHQFEIIDRYRELSGIKLASELVRLLIEETGFDALLAGLPRGEQRLANLRKVLDWLREAERGTRTTPAMAARKLAEQIANPPNVPEAAILDPAQNAVTVMTVHGSKGLTKRVVFLPDISSKQQNDTDFCHVYFDGDNAPELGLSISAPDKTRAESPGFKDAKARAKAVREHEFKNLFYVAMTRARDLVVTSGTKGKSATGWLKWMEPLIGKEIPAIPYSDLSEAADFPVTKTRDIPTAENLAAALETLLPPPAPPSLQRMPATRLAKEQDELEDSPEYEISGFTSPENAAALGSLGHAVLEQLALNGWEGDISQWLEKLRDDFGVSKPAAEKLAERIEQARELMIEKTDGTELFPEFPFVLHEDNTLIDGTVDLLCKTKNGFAIFDYKFTGTNDEQVAENYRSQMKIYRKAAGEKFPDATETDIQLIVISSKGARAVPVL